MRFQYKTVLTIGLILILFVLNFGCGEPENSEINKGDFYREVGDYLTRSLAKGFDFYGDTLFVAEHNDGIGLYDISSPASLSQIYRIEQSEKCKNVRVEAELNALIVGTVLETYFYYLDTLTVKNESNLGETEEGVDLFLTSVDNGEIDDDPEARITDFIRFVFSNELVGLGITKVFLDTLDFGSDKSLYFNKEAVVYLDWELPIIPSGLSFINDSNTLAVAMREVGVAFADVSGNPIWISDVDTPGIARDLVQSGDYLYVADGYFGVAIIDISDINNPVYMKNCKMDGFDHVIKVDINDNRLVLMDEYDGLVLLDVTNPADPKEVDSIHLREPYEAKFNPDDGYLYVTSYERGIIVFDLLY